MSSSVRASMAWCRLQAKLALQGCRAVWLPISCPAATTSFQTRRGWKEVVAAGHEIGNHTARHPCSANFAWSRHHAIEALTLDDMAGEIADANAWIADVLGVEPRTFAYPCGHTFVGR